MNSNKGPLPVVEKSTGEPRHSRWKRSILQGGAAVLVRFQPIVQAETTKNETKLPDGYRRFRAPGSPNDVFIPKEADGAITQAIALQWSEINQQSPK